MEGFFRQDNRIDRIDRIKMNYKGTDFKMREDVAAAMSFVGVHGFSVSSFSRKISTDIPACHAIQSRHIFSAKAEAS